MAKRCARHLILMLVILIGAARCAVLGSDQATPRPPTRQAPRSLSPLVVPSVGVERPVSPLPSPTLVATSVARAAPDFSLERENGQVLYLSPHSRGIEPVHV